MYPVSQAFHTAVRNNAPQMALFVFPDGVITNEDIDIEQGISFRDYFCTKDDIGIGEALSNELDFRLMNERQKLNDFPFGECYALLGVQIGHGTGTGELMLSYGGHTWRGSSAAGRRLTKDGVAVSGQPGFNPASLAAMDNKVYCFGTNGEAYAVLAGTGAQTSVPVNAFMIDKAKRFAGNTYSYQIDSNQHKILTIRRNTGYVDTYEFCPLGYFNVERPKVTDDIQIDIHANDRMLRFTSDMSGVGITYPKTLKEILTAICNSEGVTLETDSFLNMNVQVASAPEQFETCTKRDVIGWIAEAAGYNAKISRDGGLKFVWLNNNTGQSFSETGYTECRPYCYQTPRVNKLSVRNTSAGTETIVKPDGEDGKTAYLIQDNPFL